MMTRATRAEINLSVLRHNLDLSRSQTQAKQMAIIKANAYGHGLVEVARALCEADSFGVATINEAIALRESGVYRPIVLLEGFNRPHDLSLMHAYSLECVVHSEEQLAILEQYADKPIRVWLKIDTGMHRLGYSPDQVSDIYQRLSAIDSVQQPIPLMTHFACADDQDNDYTLQQIEQFDRVTANFADSEKTLANSAGILGWPTSHADWVRPGIMLYGASPFKHNKAGDLDLQPVMTLKSEIIAIHSFKKGDSIGYGQSYFCEADMPVATIAIGYGDGYPRHAINGTPVLINNQKAPLVGRVSMDMITVDIRNIKDAKVGDEVILWGEGLPVEVIAEKASTISYELLCGVTQRVEFHYF
jgi:alanine racemase